MTSTWIVGETDKNATDWTSSGTGGGFSWKASGYVDQWNSSWNSSRVGSGIFAIIKAEINSIFISGEGAIIYRWNNSQNSIRVCSRV